MSYRLQQDELLPDGLKRVAQEETTAAIDKLRAGNIYEVRKHIKKLRAVLRFLKPELGPIYVEENRRLRAIGRSFSELRDLDVSLKLLETFARQYKRKSTLDPHRKILMERRSALQQQMEVSEACGALAATCRRIEDWPLHRLTPAFVTGQSEKAHKHSSDAFQGAKQTRTAEDFHQFRKSVKRELNQNRFLNLPEQQLKDLKRLSTLLGDHHDFAVLLATLGATSNRFRHMAQRQLRLHETQILSLATRIYERPRSSAAA